MYATAALGATSCHDDSAVSIEATLTLISGVQKVTAASFNSLLTPTILFCLNYNVTMETRPRQRLHKDKKKKRRRRRIHFHRAVMSSCQRANTTIKWHIDFYSSRRSAFQGLIRYFPPIIYLFRISQQLSKYWRLKRLVECEPMCALVSERDLESGIITDVRYENIIIQAWILMLLCCGPSPAVNSRRRNETRNTELHITHTHRVHH